MDNQVTYPNKKTLEILRFAMPFSGVAYLLLVYILWMLQQKQILKPVLQFNNKFYLLLIPAFILLLSAGYIKDKIWDIRKKEIKSVDRYYSVLLSVGILVMSILESISIFGLLMFFLTGNILFAVIFILLGTVGEFIYYPKVREIENRKIEFHF